MVRQYFNAACEIGLRFIGVTVGIALMMEAILNPSLLGFLTFGFGICMVYQTLFGTIE